MSALRKSLVAALAIMSTGHAAAAQETKGPQPPSGTLFLRNVETQIAKRVETLKKESLEESLRKLDEPEWYWWPGVPISSVRSVVAPLPASDDVYDVNVVLSNRRVMKVYQQLAEMDKTEAARHVEKHLSDALASFDKLFDEYVTRNGPKFLQGVADSPESIGFQVTNRKSKAPTLYGVRYKIFALILIAGALELDAADGEVARVLVAAEAQRDRLIQGGYKTFFVSTVLSDGSLYNRQILAGGLLGTLKNLAGSPPPEIELVNRRQDLWSVRKMPRFDAAATPFDLHAARGVVPVDWSGGPLLIRYQQPIGEEEFQELVHAVRRLTAER